MFNERVFKIKDSVDLFLSNQSYIMVYYMNTRQRKSFFVNQEMIYLLENIDGKKSVLELKKIMENNYNINSKYVDDIIKTLRENKIITEISNNFSILPKELIDRYDRQINYFSEFLESEEEGIKAQKKIIDSNVAIFGCGAVGGNIALELAMAGVEGFILYDYDKVESSDIGRHMYFKEENIGYFKVNVLASELKKINNNVKIKIINDSLKPESKIENIIIDSDFVVNTLDEPYIGYTSSKISRLCVKHNIPHFIAGGFDAHLASTGELIIPYITPCVECYAGHFKQKLKGWKPEKHPINIRYMEIGGLPSMTLFSSSYACIEIIKYIAGLVNMNKDFKVRGEFLFNDMEMTYIDVKKNSECMICGGNAYES